MPPLGLLTPADVHHGRTDQRVAAPATVLATAYTAHPECFPGRLSRPSVHPTRVCIDPPKTPGALVEITNTGPPVLLLTSDLSGSCLTL
jgi:hypothetical protein